MKNHSKLDRWGYHEWRNWTGWMELTWKSDEITEEYMKNVSIFSVLTRWILDDTIISRISVLSWRSISSSSNCRCWNVSQYSLRQVLTRDDFMTLMLSRYTPHSLCHGDLSSKMSLSGQGSSIWFWHQCVFDGDAEYECVHGYWCPRLL